MAKHYTHTLSNGLRLVHVPSASRVAYCGLAINAGSRDDLPGKSGLAHFVEHTIFKGTKHRRSWHILNRMERVGGELNAYTTKEGTALYSIFPCEHFERAIELIADLVANSQFPDNELAKEREVVLEEIDSYRDTPMEAAYDDFEDLLFAGSPMGHNILGNEEELNNITANDCRYYLDTQYVPGNMVFFATGNIKSDRLFRIAEKYLGVLNHKLDRAERIVPADVPVFHKTVNIDSHQAHTIVGKKIFSMHDERKYAAFLLNNIIGGPGMNSLLNVAIREKRGYVYTVESSLSLLSDCGLFQIYFGSDNQHVAPSLRIINRTLEDLATKPMSEKALLSAKKQYLGQLLVSSENKESMALSLGKNYLYHNSVMSDVQLSEHINALTPQQIMDCAALLDPATCSILTLK